MFQSPELTSFSILYSDEARNQFFILQEHKKNKLYRILLVHENSCWQIAKGTNLQEIHRDWQWLEQNIFTKISDENAFEEIWATLTSLTNQQQQLPKPEKDQEQLLKKMNCRLQQQNETIKGQLSIYSQYLTFDPLQKQDEKFQITNLEYHQILKIGKSESQLFQMFQNFGIRLETRQRSILIFYFSDAIEMESVWTVLYQRIDYTMLQLVKCNEMMDQPQVMKESGSHKEPEFNLYPKLPNDEDLLLVHESQMMFEEEWVPGRLFIYANYLRFHSKKVLNFLFHISQITSIKKQTTLLSLLNPFSGGFLEIRLQNQKKICLQVKDRDALLQFLLDRLKHVQFPSQMKPLSPKALYASHQFVPANHEQAMTLLNQDFKPSLPLKTLESEPGMERLWLQYFQQYGRDSSMLKNGMLQQLLQDGGIPDCFRGEMWLLFSGACFDLPSLEYYTQLWLKQQPLLANSNVVEEIEKDLHRSLPEHPAFQEKSGKLTLRRVLLCFSARFPEIGYTQSMNILSAVFLLFLNEHEAFWLLCVLVERILKGFYTKSLSGILLDQYVFGNLVQKRMPQIYNILETPENPKLSMLIVPWFVCLFVNSLPLKVAFHAIDCFFLEGPTFLFKFGLAILKANEALIMEEPGDEFLFQLREFFKVVGQDPALEKKLFQMAFEMQLDLEELEMLRQQTRPQVVHNIDNQNRKLQIRNLKENTEKYQFQLGSSEQRPKIELNEREIGIILDEYKKSFFFQQSFTLSYDSFQKMMHLYCPWRQSLSYDEPQNEVWKKNLTLNIEGSSFLIRTEHLQLSHLLADSQFDSLYFRLFQFFKSKEGVDLPSLLKLLDIFLYGTSNDRIRVFFNIFDHSQTSYWDRQDFFNALNALIWLFYNREKPEKTPKLPPRSNEMSYKETFSQSWSCVLHLDRPLQFTNERAACQFWKEKAPEFLIQKSYFNQRPSRDEENFLSVLYLFIDFILNKFQVQDPESTPSSPLSSETNQLAYQTKILFPEWYLKLKSKLLVIPEHMKLSFQEFLVLVLSNTELTSFFEIKGEI